MTLREMGVCHQYQIAGEIVTMFGPSAVHEPSTDYVISSSRTLTADQGIIVNISTYSIKVSMFSYQHNVPFHCLNGITSTNSLHGSKIS